jgi:hypothetical protein
MDEIRLHREVHNRFSNQTLYQKPIRGHFSRIRSELFEIRLFFIRTPHHLSKVVLSVGIKARVLFRSVLVDVRDVFEQGSSDETITECGIKA